MLHRMNVVVLRYEADLGDEQDGVVIRPFVELNRKHGPVLDREAAQHRAAREQRVDLCLDIGQQLRVRRMRCAADLHAAKLPARDASLNQGIPEPTTRKTLGENYSRISAVSQCRTRANVRARNSSHTSGRSSRRAASVLVMSS